MFGNCVLSEEILKHGPFKKETACVRVIDLTASVTKHNVFERELIESRIGKKFKNTDEICPNHRFKLGLYWKVPTNCCHPSKCPLKGDRPMTSDQYLKVTKKFGKFSVPIEGLLCQRHRKEDLLQNNEAPVEVFAASKKALKQIRELLEIDNGHHQLQQQLPNYSDKTIENIIIIITWKKLEHSISKICLQRTLKV